jgi:hypothetical protein
VLDVEGKTIIQEQGANNGGKQVINMHALNSGIYFLKIYTRDNVIVKKITKE